MLGIGLRNIEFLARWGSPQVLHNTWMAPPHVLAQDSEQRAGISRADTKTATVDPSITQHIERNTNELARIKEAVQALSAGAEGEDSPDAHQPEDGCETPRCSRSETHRHPTFCMATYGWNFGTIAFVLAREDSTDGHRRCRSCRRPERRDDGEESPSISSAPTWR